MNKTIEITITSKGRKFFTGKLDNKYPCKLFIDELSNKLEIGDHTLYVEDLSVRSKYGTDLKFRLVDNADTQQPPIFVKSDIYNEYLTKEAKAGGGKWISDDKVWIFHYLATDIAEELDSVFNSKLIAVEIVALRDISNCRSSLNFCGQTIARAFDRDSGAKIADNITVASGSFASGGSAKNWATTADTGTTVRLEMPCKVLEKYQDSESKNWNIKIL